MITGGVKFFDANAASLAGGGSVTDELGTGAAVVQYLLSKNRYTYWSSVGSNDTTTEALALTLPPYPVSRLFVVRHNWKEFTAQYWDGAAWADFTGVSGLDGALAGGISETAFADSTAYYEVDPVTTTGVRFTATKTQVPNAEKIAFQIIVTSELGTLQGFPQVNPAKVARNSRTMTMPSGRMKVVKGQETYDCTLGFSPYSSNTAYQGDLDLLYLLHDRDLPFLMWPCGGSRGPEAFKYPLRLMRLDDVFLAQLVSDLSGFYSDSGIYTGPVDLGSLEFAEHV